MAGEKYSEILTSDPATTVPDGATLPVCQDPGGTPATEGALVGQFRTLPYDENAISADVDLTTSGTWYDGPSLSLAAGTWLVTVQLTLNRTSTTALTYYGRISDGTTHYASTQQYQSSVANHSTNLVMTALVTLASTTTIKGQATTSAGSADANILAALTANGAGNNASKMTAVRVSPE